MQQLTDRHLHLDAEAGRRACASLDRVARARSGASGLFDELKAAHRRELAVTFPLVAIAARAALRVT